MRRQDLFPAFAHCVAPKRGAAGIRVNACRLVKAVGLVFERFALRVMKSLRE
jgi:hypothetical protein